MNACPPTNWLDLVPPCHLSPVLTEAEQAALEQWRTYRQAHRYGRMAECQQQHLGRLVAPFDLIHSRVGGCRDEYQLALSHLNDRDAPTSDALVDLVGRGVVPDLEHQPNPV